MAEESPMPVELFGHRADGSPLGTTDKPRCRNCRRVLADYVTSPWQIKCPRCGAVTGA